MLDPKEHLVVVGPKKGDCYICGQSLLAIPSLQINVNIPLTKIKKVAGRVCLSCAKEIQALVDTRIAQANKGEFQA